MKMYVVTSVDPPFGRRSKRSHYEKKTQKTATYDAVEASGSRGVTAVEIAQRAAVVLDRVRFYLSELRRGGYIAVKGDPTTVSPTMNAQEAAFAAMLGLENALIARAKEGGVSAEMEKAFVRYNKLKELALRPGTIPEGKVALRLAIVELVKVVF